MVRRAPLWPGGHIAERTMILRVGRTVVYALAKQLNKEWDQKAVEIASSPESLSMAADDFADAMQNARRAIGRALRPNRANAESQQFRRRHSKCASLEFSGNALSRNAPLPMGSTFRFADKEKPRNRRFL